MPLFMGDAKNNVSCETIILEVFGGEKLYLLLSSFLSLLSSTFGFCFCLLGFSLLHSPLSLSLLFLSLLHFIFSSAFDWQSYIFFLNNESVENGLLGK